MAKWKGRLVDAGVVFLEFDGGRHVRVKDLCDFWPSTGTIHYVDGRKSKGGIDEICRAIEHGIPQPVDELRQRVALAAIAGLASREDLGPAGVVEMAFEIAELFAARVSQ